MGRRGLCERRGSQAVEFALILPVMLTMLMGVIDYGMYFSQDLAVVTAARDGARDGATATTSPASQASATALSRVRAGGVAYATAAQVTTTLTGTAPNCAVTVAVSIPYQAVTGLVPMPAALRTSATMRLEDQRLCP